MISTLIETLTRLNRPQKYKQTMRITLITAAIGFLTIISAPVNASGYFKCKDANGNIIFSDTECPVEAEILTEKTVRTDAVTGRFGSEPYLDDSNMDLQDMLKLRAHLAEALSDLTPVKLAATEFYLQQEQWPENLEALGFNPKQTNSEQIDSVKVGQQGTLIARLQESFGTNKMIVLSPSEAMDGTVIKWNCSANFSPLLTNELSCESRNIHP